MAANIVMASTVALIALLASSDVPRMNLNRIYVKAIRPIAQHYIYGNQSGKNGTALYCTVVENGIITYIVWLFNNTSWSDNQLLNCLRIVFMSIHKGLVSKNCMASSLYSLKQWNFSHSNPPAVRHVKSLLKLKGVSKEERKIIPTIKTHKLEKEYFKKERWQSFCFKN